MGLTPPRIGLFGGTFDPVHVGHLALAKSALVALPLDQVVFIPNGTPWQKPGQHTAAEHRIAMLRLSLEGESAMQLDLRETQRQGASFSIDTVREWRAEAGPNACLVLLIGSDQFHGLPSWKDWGKLLDFVHIATTQREAIRLEKFAPELEAWLQANGCESLESDAGVGANKPLSHGRVVFFRMPQVPVSATQIRKNLGQIGRSAQISAAVSPLVPKRVLDYIEQHHLYGAV
jgi:nicotinate-nucleotide adenylyltransferase